MHGLAWLPDALDVEHILASSDANLNDAAKEALIQHVDRIVSTRNLAVLPDGSNSDDAPLPKTNPHICSQPYVEVEDFDQDLADLVASATPAAQPPTACALAMASKSVGLATPSPFSLRQPSSLRMESLHC